MAYTSNPKIINKYTLTLLVWNNILALLIVLAMPGQENLCFFEDLACVLVISHVTAFICMVTIDLFKPIQDKLFGAEQKTLYFSSLIPMSVVMVPALIAGFYASLGFAQAFSINWHPDMIEIIKPGIIFSLLAFVLNILYYNYIDSVRAYYQKEIELKTAETLALESKLRVLMSELNPHMLFNTLNSIIEVVRKDSGRAENMLLELCDYYQSVLVAFLKKSVPLSQELLLCKKFINLNNYKFANLRLNIFVEDEKLHNLMLPPLIFQPLIENTLKHGFKDISPERNNMIEIIVKKKEERVLLSVIDNGMGLSQVYVADRESVGLKNCEERLKGFLGSSCTLNISCDREGTTVLLDIPYEKD